MVECEGEISADYRPALQGVPKIKNKKIFQKFFQQLKQIYFLKTQVTIKKMHNIKKKYIFGHPVLNWFLLTAYSAYGLA